jgi:hypothetical protein
MMIFVTHQFRRTPEALARGCGSVSPRPFSAGSGRALISRGSIFDLRLGQMSSGLIEWPQVRENRW